MSVLNENTLMGASAAGGYEIEQSLRFDDGRDTYLTRTPSSASNRKTLTWSAWVKRAELGAAQNIFTRDYISSSNFENYFTSTGELEITDYSSGYKIRLKTNAKYRDPSAWYHIVVAIDTTQGTNTNRVKIYVNGVQETSLATTTYPTQNLDTQYNTASQMKISQAGANGYDGYLAEFNFIDGQALTPDSFGETGDYGEWIPKRYVGTYGTNGFYLDFKDAGSLGNDAAGSNNWTPTNLAARDQMLDSPTNNFAVMNPLWTTGTTFYEGNLKVGTTASAWITTPSTIAVGADSWYIEMQHEVGINNGNCHLGIGLSNLALPTPVGFSSTSYSYCSNGNVYNNSGILASVATYAAGDIVAISFDGSTMKCYKNNTLVHTISSIPTGEYNVLTSQFSSNWSILNFGQDSSFAGTKTPQGNSDSNDIGDFYYAPPTGFLALCTKNLPDATVVPSEHFNTVLYTGNASSNAITSNIDTDFLWIKRRDSAETHALFDVIRGVDNRLESDNTGAESATGGQLTSFNVDGFTLEGSSGQTNASGGTFVAWNWKAGGTGVSNTDGTITSTVSANVDAGFSIIGYTGNGVAATVGHGLSQRPDLIITKGRSNSGVWPTWHKDLGGAFAANAGYLYLNGTGQAYTTSVFYDGTGITSSVYKFRGGNGDVNQSSRTYISYAFHSVDGYSKVGSYSGNGSSDGPMVYTGFRPAFVMIKRTDAAESWSVVDTSRNPSNYVRGNLYPSNSNAEDTTTTTIDRDMLSNGFKLRATWAGMNASGGTYIYYAIAESPFKHSNAR